MYYNALNDYLRARFGRKVYKLSLRGVTTCPNRDGTVGTRGCIFCSDSGSGEFAACGADIAAQLSAHSDCDAVAFQPLLESGYPSAGLQGTLLHFIQWDQIHMSRHSFQLFGN